MGTLTSEEDGKILSGYNFGFAYCLRFLRLSITCHGSEWLKFLLSGVNGMDCHTKDPGGVKLLNSHGLVGEPANPNPW